MIQVILRTRYTPRLPLREEQYGTPERLLHYHQSKYRCYRDHGPSFGNRLVW
jgi:hypothetical protein